MISLKESDCDFILNYLRERLSLIAEDDFDEYQTKLCGLFGLDSQEYLSECEDERKTLTKAIELLTIGS